MPKKTMAHRFAKAAVRKYAKRSGVVRADRRESYVIADLIADLMHLAQDRGYDAHQVVHAAQNYFDQEQG